MANVIQSAISSIRRKADEMLNDNQGWFRGGQFTPVQQLKENFTKAPTMSIGIAQVPNVFNPQVRQINSNFLNKAGSTLQNQFNIQKRDFNEYFINPLKEHPVLGPATTNIEKGVSALGRTAQGYGEYFKTLTLPQEQRQQQLKQLESKYTYGNAFKETKDVTKGVLTAYGLASPQTAVKSMLGGGLINTAIQGVQNVANKIPVTTGMGESFLTGAGTGLAYSGTNRLTNGLVQYFSNSIPLLNSLTEQSIQKGAPVATDTLKMGIKKFFSTAGKNILKAAVIETAVETPIWGTLNQKEQETLLQSFQREAVENLTMNVGMAGINTITDSKALFPIIKKSINDVIQNKIYSPEGIALQSGKINFGADVGNVKPSQPIKTGEVIGSEGIGTQNRNLTPQGDISAPIKQTELPVSNKVSQSQDILPLPQGEPKLITVRNKTQLKKVLAENPNANVRIELTPNKGKIATLGQVPDRADVQATLPNRINTFVDDVLGYSTQAPKGGTRQASLYTRTLRNAQNKISTGIEEAMGSENTFIRQGATFVQNFFRGLGMSPERAKASMELRGEMSVANERAYNVMDTLYKSLGNNKKSLERINAVLDPEISKIKVSFDDLSKSEKEAYGLIREGLDLVHDTSYANGHISPELYVKNKGKYTPRLYEVTELPPEVNKFVTQGKKLNNDLYKQRKNVDAWKQDNSLNDPVYALGKRLSQVETNSAIKKYTDFLASNKRFVSDVERPGFVKLSDSPVYGALSGKYVLNSAAEDLKGFFFSNQAMQNLYDVFRAYDRMPIRQLQKKLLTVFNPTTNVGNIVSDQVFGWVTGVDPFTLNKNLLDLKSNPKQFKQLSDYLMRKGITGTDITRTDFVNKLGSIDELAKGKEASKFKIATDKVQQFYGGTDDAYKVAAFKSLLDKGFTLEEATRKVADGFQNYANVGKYYDLAAKTPIIGKPFIKFQGDLMRIIKNGAVNNPLGLISFLGTLKGISYLSSKLSGESDEDRKTRETRFAAPMIPGLNIPLTWQTPIGEINVARYISPFYANNETTNIASNMLPFVPNIQKNKDFASNVAMNVNDPLLSPIVQLGVNRDFRGKPISDPDENKYQPSTLTPSEKLKNQALWTGRAYLPPPVNSAIDVGQVAATGKNMYGTPQTMTQSIARLGGVKISDMGAEEVQAIREKDAEYDQKGNEYIQKQIQSVKKQQLTGKISQETANNRIANLESQKKTVNTSLIKGSGDEIGYINEDGNMGTINLKKYDDIKNLPSDNKYNSAIKESKQYSEATKILDNTDLTTEQQQTALDRLGIDKTKADYYRVANDSDNLKTMFVLDAINKVKTQGGGFSDVIQLLANQRTEINGKQIASNGVLDNLVDEGILTKAQATELKKYKYENGQLTPKSKTGTKAKKAKKISVTLRKMSAPKLSSSKTKVKRITVPKTYKRLKAKKLKLLKLPTEIK